MIFLALSAAASALLVLLTPIPTHPIAGQPTPGRHPAVMQLCRHSSLTSFIVIPAASDPEPLQMPSRCLAPAAYVNP